VFGRVTVLLIAHDSRFSVFQNGVITAGLTRSGCVARADSVESAARAGRGQWGGGAFRRAAPIYGDCLEHRPASRCGSSVIAAHDLAPRGSQPSRTDCNGGRGAQKTGTHRVQYRDRVGMGGGRPSSRRRATAHAPLDLRERNAVCAAHPESVPGCAAHPRTAPDAAVSARPDTWGAC
jgi:hypothetical protein